METVPARHRTIEGSARLSRVGRVGFPVEKLAGEDGLLAELGRESSLAMFFGRGRRVRLADGTEWRIKSTTSGRHIVPIITTEEGTIAISGPLHANRSYGINGKDYGFTLIPLGKVGFGGTGRWVLRRFEDQIAVIDQRERNIQADEPIPVAAALMAFTLITHGIPGEGDIIPPRD